jgi:hypothetical protein
MDYLMQYKEKKQNGTVSLPRKSVLKTSITSARLPPLKPKAELAPPKAELGRRSLTNGSTTSSPKLGPLQVHPKSATAKIPATGRKK